jgi:SAM-dependent methyltransferase
MQLYIGGLSKNTTEHEVAELFLGICPVQSITIGRDIVSGISRGFAMVKLSQQEDCEKAIKQLNGSIMQGTKLVVRRMPDTLPGEMEFREWLTENASEVLKAIGIKEGQTIIDYGCGPGFFTIPAARLVGDTGRVYALDVNPRMLENIKGKADSAGLKNVEAVLLDRSELSIGLPDYVADFLMVYDVMHEIKDRPRLLKELHRVAKHGSVLSIFPMHMGTDKLLDVMTENSLFCYRERYSPSGYQGASEIVNFDKC